MDPAKLKVVELRQELQTRGLDTKGVKAVLVDRLRLALESEGAAIRDQVLGVSPTKSDGHVSQDDSAAEEDATPVEPVAEEQQPQPVPVVEDELPAPVVIPETVPIAIEDSSTEQPSVDEVAEEPVFDLDSSQAPEHLNETQPIDQTPTSHSTNINQTSHLSSATEESVSASATNASTEDVEMQSVGQRSTQPPSAIDEENDNAADVPEEKVSEDAAAAATDAEPMEVTDGAKSDEAAVDEASQETTPADELAAKAAEEAAKETAPASEEKKDGESRKRKRSRSPSPKRRTRTNSTAANTDDFTIVEDEPEIDPEKVTLSWFDSDLQLRISPTDFCDARPISDAAFGLVWAGARATHGVRVGQKVFYEVQLLQKNSRVNFEQEKNLFDLRCGWSVQESDLHLGDAPLSFGFDGEGKKVRNGAAEDYGRAFEVDDVVGVYLDLQSEPCTVEYTLNGESLGVAFELTQEELGEAALFPHIMSKNLSFKVNFGQLEKNLLTDLKAKPKKKMEAEKPVEPEAPVEEKKEEATADGEEKSADEKPSEETAPDAAATSEEVAEKAAPTEEPTPVEEEVKKEEPEATPAEDVEMKTEEECEEEEEKKTTEEETEAAASQPAEEVKEEAAKVEEAVVEEEEEPLPEIHRENLPGYIFIALVEKDQLVAGPLRPESRKECEVIMMIGLSAAGKTKWVKEYVAEHPEKKYVVLGASALIERMKNPNLGRKVESSGRRQRLSELCTRSLGALQDIAQKRRRNYILDQTNVFASAQRRKLKGFGEFRRTAVIVIPTDEEYAKRVESSKNDIDKDNSETELNEMKANFSLPTMDLTWFDEIKYTELPEEEALKLVEDYNAKGKKALPPPAKKRPNNDYRNDNRRRDFNNRDRNYSRWDNRRGGGGGYDNRGGDRYGAQRSGGGGGGGGGGGAHPYHSGGGGGGGGGYRRYDDRRQDRWGGSSGGGGGGASGGGSSGNWMNNNRRDFRSGGGGVSGGGRSDYGSRDSHRDQHRNQYSSSSRDYHSSSSSSSSYRRDGRDQDFRERRRDDGGITNRRYEAPRAGGAVATPGRQDYHKRDNGSAKAPDMMNNGAASQWNNTAANWQQQQLQWSQWQQGQGAQAADWNQGWATALPQGWQSGAAAGWGQAATNSTTSGSAGQWKSYGSAGTGTSGAASGAASGTAGSTGQWNGQQWTGGSY